MVFNRFRFFVLLRVLILFATVSTFVYLIFFDQKYVTTVVTGFIIIFEIYELFNFLENTNKKLQRFLDSIKYNDFNMSFTHDNKLGKTFKELNLAFKEVVDAILEERQKREEFFQELQIVIDNIASGIISVDEAGNIKMINNSALQLLNISSLKHSNRLNHNLPQIKAVLDTINDQSRSVYKTPSGQELAIFKTQYKLGNTPYTLLAIQDIKAELQNREIEAWQNLTKVLRHEIMNSMAPISSLTSTLQEIVNEDVNENQISDETLEDLNEGLSTISGRSDGLISFINAYRDYTNLPEPSRSDITINDLVSQTVKLMDADNFEIKAEVSYSKTNTTLFIDNQMVEQVLINILKNAFEAVDKRENSSVNVHVESNSISISDNGPGIIEEAREKIFMPFYSTKNRGSGIGLSLSKQIMQLHGGDITLETEVGKGSTFTLHF